MRCRGSGGGKAASFNQARQERPFSCVWGSSSQPSVITLCETIEGVDESSRRAIYIVFLMLALVVAPLSWVTTVVPRASLGLSRERLSGLGEGIERLSLMRVHLIGTFSDYDAEASASEGDIRIISDAPHHGQAEGPRAITAPLVDVVRYCISQSAVEHPNSAYLSGGEEPHTWGRLAELLAKASAEGKESKASTHSSEAGQPASGASDGMHAYDVYVVHPSIAASGGPFAVDDILRWSATKDHMQARGHDSASLLWSDLFRRTSICIASDGGIGAAPPSLRTIIRGAAELLMGNLNESTLRMALSSGEGLLSEAAAYQMTVTLAVGQDTEGPVDLKGAAAASAGVPPQDSPESHPRGGSSKRIAWEGRRAVSAFLAPLIEQLCLVADVAVHIQERPFVSVSAVRSQALAGGSRHRQDGHATVIEEDQLASFVEDGKWNIGGPLSAHATPINFIVLVPSDGTTPMYVASRSPSEPSGGPPSDGAAVANRGQFFGYKQWGGVYVHNHFGSGSIGYEALEPAMAAIASQLWRLFGIDYEVASPREPHAAAIVPGTVHCSWMDSIWSSSSLMTGKVSSSTKGGASHRSLPLIDPTIPVRLFDGLISRLTRVRLQRALQTLGALNRLLGGDPNIAVLGHIRGLVASSIASIDECKSHLRQGEHLLALRAASRAQQWSDLAFFDDTMMGHQYFPQEHKVGVYLPLFFPFILPVATATILGLAAHLRAILGREKRQKSGGL